jgi:hypothetical protein
VQEGSGMSFLWRSVGWSRPLASKEHVSNAVNDKGENAYFAFIGASGLSHVHAEHIDGSTEARLASTLNGV